LGADKSGVISYQLSAISYQLVLSPERDFRFKNMFDKMKRGNNNLFPLFYEPIFYLASEPS